MTFTSPEFVIFFAAFVPLYFLIAPRLRWSLLLIASYFFYAYGSGIYVVLIITTTLIDYTAARLMGRTSNSRRRKLFLAASLTANLGKLFIFKYFNFYNQSLSSVVSYPSSPLNVIHPHR